MQSVAIIILAAGKGTRMKSDTAKVLHRVSGRPMILYVVNTAVDVAGENVIVVVGTQAEQVKTVVSSDRSVYFAYQEHQRGTGHAVLCALPILSPHVRHVVILCGDVPLIRSHTIRCLIEEHQRLKNDVTIVGAEVDNPFGYGRLIRHPQGQVERIVEEADATESQKAIKIINSGIYCVERSFLAESLKHIKTHNAQQEMYLTDIVGMANEQHKKVGLIQCADNAEIIGINTIQDLNRVEAILTADEKP